MKTGIELITIERQEQIEKHLRSIEDDSKYNSNGQLVEVVNPLIYSDSFMDIEKEVLCPSNWNLEKWLHVMNKSYKERLVIAGALIAAEIDRIQFQEGE
jgi:hypothetical protein